MTTTPQAALLSAHWYSIDKHGAATLCVDEDDAKATAIDSQTLYPRNGPYRAVQMAPIEPVQAGELPEPDGVFYCSEDTGYLTQYRRPPANLTDGDVAMYEADTVRSLLQAALSARKPTGAWQDVSACPDGDVWFSLSCGHVVMGYKHGSIFDWEASIDHDCCGDATATKAMSITPPDSHGIGLEVKT